jgi:hypothetical protein
VSRQMYLHKNPETGFVPGNVLFDDRLPPTPPDGFHQEPSYLRGHSALPARVLANQAARSCKLTGSNPEPVQWHLGEVHLSLAGATAG